MMRSIWILTTVLTLLSHVRTTDINHTLLPIISHGDIPVDCDPKFFEMTEKNLKESKSDEFYRGFITEEAKKHPEDYTRLGEVSFFAHQAFNGLDVRCGSHLRGCSGIPTCREVLDHVQRHGGDKDKARKIYFSIKKIDFIVDTIFWFHRASAVIEHHASLVSEIILKEFAPKRHMVASDNCKAVKASFNAVASVTKTFETIVSPSPDNFSVASIFSLAMKLVDGFGAQGKDHVDNILLEKAIHDVIEFPELEGRKTAVEKLCDVEVKRVSADEKKTQHGKGPKPEDLSHQSDILKKHVIRVTSSVRETVSNILSIIVSGNITARPGFSCLHELMSRNDWSENARRLYESFDEKRITRIFEDSLMSSIWEDGKCYQKCVCKADGSAWNFCDTRSNNAAAKFRYCPDDCACQLQCLSSNMDGRKNEVELIGLEQLESWDVDFRDILIRSYHKYRENGPGLEKSDRSFDKLYKSHSELFELPTCVSYQLDMGDLKETGRHNNLFPCTCGDWRSNETQIFMRQLGFGMFQPGYKTDQAKELLTRDCPAVLTKARLKPFNRFLALCELGVRWPHHNDGKDSHGAIKRPERHRVHHNMIDSHCRKLKKETEGMTEEEANFHFCIMSKTAQEVFDSELSHVSGGGFLRPVVASMRIPDGGNHKHLCKQYLHY